MSTASVLQVHGLDISDGERAHDKVINIYGSTQTHKQSTRGDSQQTVGVAPTLKESSQHETSGLLGSRTMMDNLGSNHVCVCVCVCAGVVSAMFQPNWIP